MPSRKNKNFIPQLKLPFMKKIKYNGYFIIEVEPNKDYIASIDWSHHKSIVSAQYHIDHLTK